MSRNLNPVSADQLEANSSLITNLRGATLAMPDYSSDHNFVAKHVHTIMAKPWGNPIHLYRAARAIDC